MSQLFVTTLFVYIVWFVSPCDANFTFLYPSLPEPSWCHATAIYNHTLTVFSGTWDNTGGIFKWRQYSHSSSLNPYTGTWTKHNFTNPGNSGSLMSIRQNFVQVDYLVYVINPQTDVSSSTGQMYVFDLKANSYSVSRRAQPERGGYHGCTVYNDDANLIYHLGGTPASSASPFTYLQVYDIGNNAWQQKSNLLQGKFLNGCAMNIDRTFREMSFTCKMQYFSFLLKFI
eukprot:847765_1